MLILESLQRETRYI